MQQRDETVSNTSSNPCFTQILVERLSRRRLLQGGLVAAGMAMLHGPLVSGRGQRAEAAGALFGFPGVPVSKEDTVVVPPGYTAEVSMPGAILSPMGQRSRRMPVTRPRNRPSRLACSTMASSSSPAAGIAELDPGAARHQS